MNTEYGVVVVVVVVVVMVVAKKDMDTTSYHTIDHPQPGLGWMIIIGNCSVLKVSENKPAYDWQQNAVSQGSLAMSPVCHRHVHDANAAKDVLSQGQSSISGERRFRSKQQHGVLRTLY